MKQVTKRRKKLVNRSELFLNRSKRFFKLVKKVRRIGLMASLNRSHDALNRSEKVHQVN